MRFKNIIQSEIKAIFTNKALLLTVFVGVVFYSFLYPLPYLSQVPTEQSIVVVNLDQSQLSRKIERMVDATPEVKIVDHAFSIERGKELILQKKVSGLLVIPRGFYKDLMMGKSPTLAFGGDASYFLIYGNIAKGLATVSGTLSAQVKVMHLLAQGDAIPLAKDQYTTFRLNLRPVFNTTGGYISYIVPAVFIFILHQTLIIGLGLLGGEQNQMRLSGKFGYWLKAPIWKLLLVRVFIFLVIYTFLFMYYCGFSFVHYGIQRYASIYDLFSFLLPFLLAVISLGIIVGEVISRREYATVIILLSSLPLVFSAGFVWPVSELPFPVYWLSQFFPSTPGIQGFLKLNQMGADFSQVILLWGQLWLQTIAYGTIAYLLFKSKRRSN